MAKSYGITRSPEGGLVNIAIERKGADGTTTPVRATVAGKAVSVGGESAQLRFRELVEDGTVSYLSEFPVSAPDTYAFTITITPEGTAPAYTLKFNQDFVGTDSGVVRQKIDLAVPLSATRPLREDRVHRIEPVEQRGRPRLQDDRRLDLVKRAVAHRRDRGPAGPCREAIGPEFLAAPRAEHDVGRAPHDLAGIGEDAGRARAASRRAPGNTSSPPAMRISSATQRMPVISGSSHSSK